MKPYAEWQKMHPQNRPGELRTARIASVTQVRRTMKRETDAGRRQLVAMMFAWVVGMSEEGSLLLLQRVIDLRDNGETETQILTRHNRRLVKRADHD